jgi:hypothetical protein
MSEFTQLLTQAFASAKPQQAPGQSRTPIVGGGDFGTMNSANVNIKLPEAVNTWLERKASGLLGLGPTREELDQQQQVQNMAKAAHLFWNGLDDAGKASMEQQPNFQRFMKMASDAGYLGIKEYAPEPQAPGPEAMAKKLAQPKLFSFIPMPPEEAERKGQELAQLDAQRKQGNVMAEKQYKEALGIPSPEEIRGRERLYAGMGREETEGTDRRHYSDVLFSNYQTNLKTINEPYKGIDPRLITSNPERLERYAKDTSDLAVATINEAIRVDRQDPRLGLLAEGTFKELYNVYNNPRATASLKVDCYDKMIELVPVLTLLGRVQRRDIEPLVTWLNERGRGEIPTYKRKVREEEAKKADQGGKTFLQRVLRAR